jgi:hypothetical protein
MSDSPPAVEETDSSSAERLGVVAAKYTREEVDAKYPSNPSIDSTEESGWSVQKTVSSVYAGLREGFRSKQSRIFKVGNKIANQSETMRDFGAVATIEDISTKPEIDESAAIRDTEKDISSVILELDNGVSHEIEWRFEKDRSTRLQRFVDYYGEGDFTNLRFSSCYVDEDGIPILPNGSDFVFQLTNNLRPYGLTHPKPTSKGSGRCYQHVTDRHYDFGIRVYGNATLATSILAFPSIVAASATFGFAGFTISYLVFHAAASYTAKYSSNDGTKLAYWFPWFFSFIFFFFALVGMFMFISKSLAKLV